MEGRTIGLPHQQDWGYSAADAAAGTGPVRRELARVHYAEITLTIDDLADNCLPAKDDCGGQSARQSLLALHRFDRAAHDFNHGLVATVNECSSERNGHALEAANGLRVETELERF